MVLDNFSIMGQVTVAQRHHQGAINSQELICRYLPHTTHFVIFCLDKSNFENFKYHNDLKGFRQFKSLTEWDVSTEPNLISLLEDSSKQKLIDSTTDTEGGLNISKKRKSSNNNLSKKKRSSKK